jgi:hypothetical protein
MGDPLLTNRLLVPGPESATPRIVADRHERDLEALDEGARVLKTGVLKTGVLKTGEEHANRLGLIIGQDLMTVAPT